MSSHRLCFILTFVSSASLSYADVTLQIGAAGGGNTIWSWGGAGTAAFTGEIVTGTFIEWGHNSGHDFTTINLATSIASLGSGTIFNDTTGSSVVFTTAFYDDDPGPDDNIGFVAPGIGSPALSWSNGDIIRMSGTMTVPVSITDLDESPLPFFGVFEPGLTFCGRPSSCGLPNLRVTIVPEPTTSFLLLSAGVLGIGSRFRRGSRTGRSSGVSPARPKSPCLRKASLGASPENPILLRSRLPSRA